MTDLLSVFFLIGIAVAFMIFSFIWKNMLFTIMSGLAWIVVSIYLFSKYYSGDPDFGNAVFGLSWLTLASGMGMLFRAWWVSRRKTELIQGKGENFYSEEDPDYKEISDSYKARAARKKLRGR
jgi:hypothetical protein